MRQIREDRRAMLRVWTSFLLIYLLKIVRQRNAGSELHLETSLFVGENEDKESWSLGDWVDVYSNKPGPLIMRAWAAEAEMRTARRDKSRRCLEGGADNMW